MNRKILILLSFMIVATYCTTFAKIIENVEEEIVENRYISISQGKLDFKKLNNNLVKCYGRVMVYSGAVAYVKVELQQKDSYWETIKEWSNKGGNMALVSEEYYVESNYDYRIKVTYEAHDENGNVIESDYDYSGVIEL